jgi:hypothetical protein
MAKKKENRMCITVFIWLQTNMCCRNSSSFSGICPENVELRKCINIYATLFCGSKNVASTIVHTLCIMWVFMWPWMNEHCGCIGVGTEWKPSVFNAHACFTWMLYSSSKVGYLRKCFDHKSKSFDGGTMRWINVLYNSYAFLCLLVLLALSCRLWVHIRVVGLVHVQHMRRVICFNMF